ncbi:MAG: NAD-dependent epimerase/dehydratase family protein [Methylococcaceae bacterium]|nr:NAD-dependent epimerase/dehydratase family protein [Methylococcaceae bacterium]
MTLDLTRFPVNSKNSDINPKSVCVLGATSLVGDCLLPLLKASGWQVTAFSRQSVEHSDNVTWRHLSSSETPISQNDLDFAHYWISLAPIWVLPDYFDFLLSSGIQRIVILSSTSLFTKGDSSDPKEQAITCRMAEAEARVQEWAESSGIEWVILRPTLIYGLGRDKNIAEIARFIHRLGFFPLFGQAKGFRQPVHAQDVAGACIQALQAPVAGNKAYNITGGEILSYRDMVARIFVAMGRKPCLLPVPLAVFRMAIALLRIFPRYQHWSSAMAERMNRDMVFDHHEAAQDLMFSPRRFELSKEDVAF